jgi:hypothetical protein
MRSRVDRVSSVGWVAAFWQPNANRDGVFTPLQRFDCYVVLKIVPKFFTRNGIENMIIGIDISKKTFSSRCVTVHR